MENGTVFKKTMVYEVYGMVPLEIYRCYLDYNQEIKNVHSRMQKGAPNFLSSCKPFKYSVQREFITQPFSQRFRPFTAHLKSFLQLKLFSHHLFNGYDELCRGIERSEM